MGQTTETKPVIPMRLIPSGSMCDYGIVGRHYSQRPAYQDGGQFYDLETGDLVMNLGQLVAGDSDTAGADLARRRFLSFNPWYRMASIEEQVASQHDGAYDPAEYGDGQASAPRLCEDGSLTTEQPEPPAPRLTEREGNRYLNGERIMTASDAAMCARVLIACERTAERLRAEDYVSAMKMYELIGGLQYHMFGGACFRELGSEL